MKRLRTVNAAIVGGGWTGLAMAKEITPGLPSRWWRWKVAGHGKRRITDELDYAIRFRMIQNIADETITHRHSGREAAVPVRQYGFAAGSPPPFVATKSTPKGAKIPAAELG